MKHLRDVQLIVALSDQRQLLAEMSHLRSPVSIIEIWIVLCGIEKEPNQFGQLIDRFRNGRAVLLQQGPASHTVRLRAQ